MHYYCRIAYYFNERAETILLTLSFLQRAVSVSLNKSPEFFSFSQKLTSQICIDYEHPFVHLPHDVDHRCKVCAPPEPYAVN